MQQQFPCLFALRGMANAPAESWSIESARSALATAAPSEDTLVAAGDTIDVQGQSFLRGHGTHAGSESSLRATVTGVVERVNKLVSVCPVQSRYFAEAGDVVVGRVTELAGRRWKLDIGAKQDASLALSAVTLPGGEQRRRTDLDELGMRQMFAENNVLMCEVQSVGSDGHAQLHTRSNRYGQLHRGQIVHVHSTLIGRHRPHSHQLIYPLPAIVLGRNGIVWIGQSQSAHADSEGTATDDSVGTMAAQKAEPDGWHADDSKAAVDKFEGEARAANSVRALARAFLPVTPEAVQSVCDVSSAKGVRAKDVANDSFVAHLLEIEIERRSTSHVSQ